MLKVKTKNSKEYIMCSAIHFDDGRVHVHQPINITRGFVVAGRRHHNCFHTLKACGHPSGTSMLSIQGFLTSEDRFVTREIAADLAFKAGQIDKKITSLFSENIW